MISFYGFFMALGFLTGSFVIWRRAKDEALDEEKIFDGIIVTTLFGLLGARIHFLLLNFEYFGFNIVKWFWLTRYIGLRFYGGLLGGTIGLWWMVSSGKMGPAIRRTGFWQIADIAVFGLALGQAVTKIGCFLNNQDWTQMGEAVLVLLIFYLLLRLEREYRLFDWYRGKKDKAAPGFLSLTYLIIYSLGRIFLEIWRESELYWRGIKINQVISGLIFVLALGALYCRSGRELREDRKQLISFCLALPNKVKFKLKRSERKVRKRVKARIKVGQDIKD